MSGFAKPIELASPIAYSTFQTQIERGDFPDGMSRCGQEGFSIRRVAEDDLETTKRLSPPVAGTWEDHL